MWRAASLLAFSGALSMLTLILLGTRVAGIPPLGALLDPKDGFYRTARLADAPPAGIVRIHGVADSVLIVWDERSVPHIFAGSGLAAVSALGYVHAYHRLFQLDFIPRAASGRLAAALGPAAVEADAFLRRTGMDWGARRNLERIEQDAGLELEILKAYCRGVNAYVDRLANRDLPFEFRLLGYEPDRCTPIQSLRVLQYMNFDLTYRSDDAAYGWLRRRLTDEDYALLYPENPDYSIPIIPSVGNPGARRSAAAAQSAAKRPSAPVTAPPSGSSAAHAQLSPLLEGYLPGKGSNNWAVAGDRSATGKPILAGDMHLAVTLPAIWYEAHIVTPEINAYGVTIPGAPFLVEAFNEHLGWAFTNTGSDQIDHYRVDVDSSATRYRYDGAWREIELVVDTIWVNGGEAVLDTLRYTHLGPLTYRGGEWIAERWVAHEPSRTLLAIWLMNHARSHDEFQEALRYWDTPMQNILYADTAGAISIRSTGYLPVRRNRSGAGLLDGDTSASAWTGRVPFEELPYASVADRDYLTSTNQKPTDASYPYYLGHDWGDRTYRSIRIDTLLRSRPSHTVRDFQNYQSDVYAVQRDFFIPLIDTLSGLTGSAHELRRMLTAWDGSTSLDRNEPIAFHFFLTELERLAWDEGVLDAVMVGPRGDTLPSPLPLPRPAQTRLYYLLANQPRSPWLDMTSTLERETAAQLLRRALESAAAELELRYGWMTPDWRWGRRHGIRFHHLISALTPLGRGPIPYPGYDQTLSPAADTLATHSASWRVVVDFSQSPPRAVGVYPGGQNGNPFSTTYDLHIGRYVAFEYYTLRNVRRPEDLMGESLLHQTTITPE